MAFHIGDEILHLDEWWEEPVSVDFVFFQPDEMRNYLERAGLEIEEVIEREPYPDVEHPSRRAYIFLTENLCRGIGPDKPVEFRLAFDTNPSPRPTISRIL